MTVSESHELKPDDEGVARLFTEFDGQQLAVTSDARELHIEFDGQQVTVRTDVNPMFEYVSRTFQSMLVERATNAIGVLNLVAIDGGFSIRGVEALEIEGKVESLYDYVKQALTSHFIKTRQDLLWLHASAVEREGKSVLFVGPSGQGKSTLATHLTERGWNFMSDDIAPVRMSSDEVLPFPVAPSRRLRVPETPFHRELESIQKEMIPIPQGSVRRESAPVTLLVFPVFELGVEARLTRMAPGTAALELLRSYTNFADHREAGVARAATLARTIPAYELTYADGADAAILLDSRY